MKIKPDSHRNRPIVEECRAHPDHPGIYTVWGDDIREQSEGCAVAQCLRVQGSRGATLPVASTTGPLLAALLVLSLFRFIIPAIDAASQRGH